MPEYVTGVDIVLRAFEKRVEGDVMTIKEGLDDVCEVILDKALELCPVDKGIMIATGHIETTNKKGLQAEAAVVFGGPTAPYTLYVHEDLTKQHEEPTCAKWLEKAYRLTIRQQQNALQRRIEGDKGVTKTLANKRAVVGPAGKDRVSEGRVLKHESRKKKGR